MKHCPTCNRTYNDPALFFCPQDGAALVADAPSYQQPAPQQPPAPGQQFYPQNAPQMSFGQQAAGQSKGLAKAAMILGIVSFALLVVAGARLWHHWGYFRYNGSFPTDFLFWGMFVPALLFLALAILLGLIAVVMSLKNPARYGGKLHALAGTFPAAILAVLVLACFSYARMKAPSRYTSIDVNTYNSNTHSSNANSYSSNGSTYSSNSNSYSSNTSPTTMSDDDKYRLFYAASKTGDRDLMLRASQKIGIFDQSGRPTPAFKSFMQNSITWAMRDTDFVKTVDTPDKARAYVNAHM